jgi:hypothetical protein
MKLLRVDSSAVQAMAGRWAAAAGELSGNVVPPEVGLSCQASTAAVAAAHADITTFTEALAARVGGHATRVGDVDAAYLDTAADTARAISAVMPEVSAV